MKNICLWVLFLITLSACAGASSGHEGCTKNGELCIGMQMLEPIVFGDSNTITITVSSTIDISNLTIYLNSIPQVLTEDLGGWANHGINWTINLVAKQPQNFTKHILLPDSNGYFQIQTSASTNQLRVVYLFIVHQQDGIASIYYANTPIPSIQGPLPTIGPDLLETLHAVPTPTNSSTLTPYPTNTSTPTPWVYPPPATPPLDAPGEGPYP